MIADGAARLLRVLVRVVCLHSLPRPSTTCLATHPELRIDVEVARLKVLTREKIDPETVAVWVLHPRRTRIVVLLWH